MAIMSAIPFFTMALVGEETVSTRYLFSVITGFPLTRKDGAGLVGGIPVLSLFADLPCEILAASGGTS